MIVDEPVPLYDGLDLTDVVLDAFAGVLDEVVGPDDDFFGLGGDSLAGMVVLSELQEHLGVRLAPTAVLSHPTARRLSEAIRSGEVVEPEIHYSTEHVAPQAGTGCALASLVQESHLLVAPATASRGYLTWIYQLNGRLDVPALANAIDDVVRRHEILRTRFEYRDGRFWQVAMPFTPGVLEVIELTRQSKLDALTAAVEDTEARFRMLVPSQTPHLQAVLYDIAPKTAVFSLFVAETLVDSDSGAFVEAELSRAYAVQAGHPVNPELPKASDASYLDYVAARPVHQSAVSRAREHWEAQARRVPVVTGWPLEPRDAPSSYVFELPAEEWALVVAAAQALRTTPYVLILTSLQIALARTGLGHLLIDSVATDRSDPATEAMIGNFQAPVRIEALVQPEDRLIDVLARTAGAVREAVTHYVVPPPAPGVGAAVAFFMFKRHEGPVFKGVRRRRFRVSGEHSRPLRLTCSSGPDGKQDFVFSSTTAPAEALEMVATTLRAVLDSVTCDPLASCPAFEPVSVGAP